MQAPASGTQRGGAPLSVSRRGEEIVFMLEPEKRRLDRFFFRGG
jgi:hypothetical protein